MTLLEREAQRLQRIRRRRLSHRQRRVAMRLRAMTYNNQAAQLATARSRGVAA